MSEARIKQEIVTVFGGSGFVGRYVVQALARRGYRVRAAVRRPDLAGHLQTHGVVGQIHAVQANVRNRDSIARAVAGSHAVVNLVGILFEAGKQTFDRVQAEAPGWIAAAAKEAGAHRVLQMSAIGADPDSPAEYGRSKADGEAAALDAFKDTVVVRPSIIFGAEDGFFNRFAEMARFLPALPLIGGGHTRFQPVFVGDVAEAVARAVDGNATPGTIYELGGPEIRSFKELLDLMFEETRRPRLLLPLPVPVAKFQARLMQLLPNPMLTVDQVRLLEHDNVVSDAAIKDGRTLDGLGIAETAMASVLPSYLWRFRPDGQFEREGADAT
ncbi:MAG: complex I NDUFA9 subunit family protein [Pseudomonadota bacterium]